MAKQKDKQHSEERRKLLKYGLGATLGGIIGWPLISRMVAQETSSKAGDKVKVLTTEGKVVEVDRDQLEHFQKYEKPARGRPARKGISNRKFVMVIDLSRCKNARACVEACQQAHCLRPEQEYIQVLKMQDSGDTSPYWFPKPCYHCDNASCVDVCPVEATYKRDDGLVLIDSNRCIGCKYCMVACPYQARIYHWQKPIETDQNNKEYSAETSVPPKQGTVGKCDFCPDMARNDKLPHCVTACPEGVIFFGDMNEDTVTNGYETHRFTELIRNKSGYTYMEYFGTEPNVYYLPPVDRIYPFEETIKKEKG